MNTAAKIVSEEDNNFYPLPKDYADLTTEGKRRGRVNATRQWHLKGIPIEQRRRAYIAALNFFDLWYLWPDESIGWDPLFYDDQPIPNPSYAWAIARQWISFRQNITIAPRGGIKTKHNEKDMMMRILSRNAYSFFYATSTHPNARMTGESIKGQLVNNKRINDDFAPEMMGRIVPRRGDASFATEFMMLNNRSWIRLVSAQSFLRGGRPRRFRLDDPEYDPKAETSMATIREYMQILLFKVVFPMIARPGTGVDWIGTFVSKRHYLWHAMRTEETPEGVRAADARFNQWSRLHIPVDWFDEDGKRVSCWPEMWPATLQDRLHMAETNTRYFDAISLEEIEEAIGTANFNSEYRGQPGDSEDSCFAQYLDYDQKGSHAYWFESTDEWILTHPFRSDTLICWYELKGGEKKKMSMSLKVFLFEYARVFMTADPANTSGPDSDFRVSTCMAWTPNNDLFVLDLWAARCKQEQHVKAIFGMADRWKAPTVHPEAIREGVALFNTLHNIVSTKASDLAGNVTHLPAIRKCNPGMERKEDKIHSLLFRFEHGKIKLPMWKRHVQPWAELFNQIEEFNPDVEDGGLQHDDHIDTVAMSKFILKGRLSRSPKQDVDDRSFVDRLIEGDIILDNGTNIAQGLDIGLLSYHDVERVLAAREGRMETEHGPTNKI